MFVCSLRTYQLLQRYLERWKNESSLRRGRFKLLGNIPRCGLRSYLRHKRDMHDARMKRLGKYQSKDNEGPMLLVRGDKVFMSPSPKHRDDPFHDNNHESEVGNGMEEKKSESYAEMRRSQREESRSKEKYLGKGEKPINSSTSPYSRPISSPNQVDRLRNLYVLLCCRWSKHNI